MIIETKYNIEDEVWFIYHNLVLNGKITGFKIIKSNNMCDWRNDYLIYSVNGLPIQQQIELEEKRLFKTKEELIASL